MTDMVYFKFARETFFVLMRQGMGDWSTVTSLLLGLTPPPFRCPSITGTPPWSLIITVQLAPRYDSWLRSQLSDYYFCGMWWDWRLGNSLNDDGIRYLTGPKWLNRATDTSIRRAPSALSSTIKIKKNIQFTSWLDIEGKILNNQMIKRLVPIPQCGHDHWKLPYFNGFTASNLCPPPYCHLYSIENTHISGRHFQQRPLGGAAKLFSTPLSHSCLSLFLNCLPSVTRSVTSLVILPCVCKSWLFVLKRINLVEVCCPPPPPPEEENKQTNIVVESLLPLGASWLLPPLRLSLHTSCIHPFIHPFNIHPSDDDDSGDQDWDHPSGLLEEVMVLRRAVVLCRRCSGWIR